MVIKWKAKSIMPPVASNYGGGWDAQVLNDGIFPPSHAQQDRVTQLSPAILGPPPQMMFEEDPPHFGFFPKPGLWLHLSSQVGKRGASQRPVKREGAEMGAEIHHKGSYAESCASCFPSRADDPGHP